MSTSKLTMGSISLLTLVLVVLVILKLAAVGAVATWSWWWVLAPLWGPWALAVLAFLAYCWVGRALYTDWEKIDAKPLHLPLKMQTTGPTASCIGAFSG